jgi:hypothetical protein
LVYNAIRERVDNAELLGVTNIGSHMWQMNHAKSDIDLGVIYIAPTNKILRGTAYTESKQLKIEELDVAVHEIGKVVDMLISGNVNFLCIVSSPIIMLETPYLRELKNILNTNLSANTYHSIKGLSMKNYKKYLVDGNLAEGEGIEIFAKKRKIIMRTLNFGIKLLNAEGMVYEPASGNYDNQSILDKIIELDNIYKDTILPEKPDKEIYYDFLEKVRRDYDR